MSSTLPNREKDHQAEPVFLDIGPEVLPTEIEGVCFNCMKMGTARILLTKIPYFREVMISRFECPHCHFSNNSVQFAGEFPAKGVKYHLHVNNVEDLNRRVVKSSNGIIKIPEIELEIPGPTQADSISTVQGVLEKCYATIKAQNPEPSPRIAEFLENLEACSQSLIQFNFELDDPSGNSFIENPSAPRKDPLLEVQFYARTPEMNEAIGLMAQPKPDNFQLDDESELAITSKFATGQAVQEIESQCPVCSQEGLMRSCQLAIPYFKEIIIMSFRCEQCGYHNGEVMVGGGTSSQGCKLTLQCSRPVDLNREIIKSDMASIKIPECDLDLVPGTLGGKFTTIEGILNDIHKQLEENNPFARGDSAITEDVQTFDALLAKLASFAHAEAPFTFILDDPLANSSIQPLGENDERLKLEPYERTFEQNEMLGLNDIKTEGYESAPPPAEPVK